VTRLLCLALLVTVSGCKKAPATAPAEPAPAAAPAPAPAPNVVDRAPETPPAPAPKPEVKAANAEFEAAFSFGDGSARRGKVRRIERATDWYGEKGWTDNANKLTISLEHGDKAKDVPWTDVKTIEIEYLGRSAIGCDYDSNFSPIMYTCTMKTKSRATLKDGSVWDVTTRNRWKFEMSDGSFVEFYAYKLPARQNEGTEAEIGDGSTQNFKLYETLQDDLVNSLKTKDVVTRITIN
jgi:hypothetical protein